MRISELNKEPASGKTAFANSIELHSLILVGFFPHFLQRQRKIQKDRLVAEFTTSLTNFQKVQRQAAEKEKEFVARVRASSRVSVSI